MGRAARTLNGVGAVLWLIAAAGLIRSLWGKQWRWTVGVVVLGWVVPLAFLVRPRDLAAAVVSFMIAGAVVAAVARRQPLQWTLLMPALWLPVHLLLGIGRALLADGGRLRTEPPPTAALVPLAMVVSAAAGGLVVTWWQRRRLRGEIAGSPRLLFHEPE